MNHCKDAFGQSILPGCTVVYAGRRGSSLWLTKGSVIAVTTRGIDVQPEVHKDDRDLESTRKPVTLTNKSTIVVLEAPADHYTL